MRFDWEVKSSFLSAAIKSCRSVFTKSAWTVVIPVMTIFPMVRIPVPIKTVVPAMSAIVVWFVLCHLVVCRVCRGAHKRKPDVDRGPGERQMQPESRQVDGKPCMGRSCRRPRNQYYDC